MRRALIFVALVACTDEPAPSGPNVTSHVASLELPPKVPGALDLMFVVGELGAHDIGALATIVETEIPRWYDGFYDLRVVTSMGVLEMATDVYGHHTQSFSGSLAAALAPHLASGSSQVLATIPTKLEAVRANASFGVLIASAVDDMSPAVDYAAMIKATRTGVAVSGLYQRPAPRLDSFLEAIPNANAFTSIDANDHAPAFTLFQQLQRTTLEGPPCVELPLDVDPNTPGDQVDCDVSALTEDGVELERIPLCHGAPATGTCWELVADPQNCLTGDTRAFRLKGVWARYRPRIRWQCVVK